MRKQLKRLSLAKETLASLQKVELSEVQGAESSYQLQFSVCAECLWPSINFPCETDYGYASCIPYC
jgi:hypothetical protein